ncbi:MAG: SDR family oxidoreductase [Haliea sp.]|jgi:3-oxoacyl-[acyl-carrier protein] reductase|nr:SDR family oxidoreductase [Haliea sp.]
MDLGLKNANVLVSGGTGGMGRAAADCFAADGARVAVMARSRAELDSTVAALKKLGAPDAVGLQADLFDGASVDAALAELGRRWGHLNAVVNAAGPLSGGLKTFETYTDEEWQNVYSGLLMGAVRTIRAALPLLRKAPWARIVNVSAMSTKRQSPPLVAYTSAKAALTSVSKNLSQSLAPEGILVNTVSPGTFVSESFKASMAPIPDLDENDLYAVMGYINKNFGHHVFLNRAAEPAEIGPVIAFAASARNTYMTGANINVDGGSDFT